MISGEVLKYRKGLFIRGRYETCLRRSSRVPLTMPAASMIADKNPAVFHRTFVTNTGRVQCVKRVIAALEGLPPMETNHYSDQFVT